MLTCVEQGLWPDNITEDMDERKLDALVEHASACPYHQAILDRDEEEFLINFRIAEGLMRVDSPPRGHMEERRGTLVHGVLPMTDSLTFWLPRGRGDVFEGHYAAYQRWSRERCPLEILQIRWGAQSISVIELEHGGAWHLRIEPGTSVIQFWTFCRRHRDEVLVATYPLAAPAANTDVADLSFPNGQRIRVSVTVREGGGYDLYLSCVQPRVSKCSSPFVEWRKVAHNIPCDGEEVQHLSPAKFATQIGFGYSAQLVDYGQARRLFPAERRCPAIPDAAGDMQVTTCHHPVVQPEGRKAFWSYHGKIMRPTRPTQCTHALYRFVCKHEDEMRAGVSDSGRRWCDIVRRLKDWVCSGSSKTHVRVNSTRTDLDIAYFLETGDINTYDSVDYDDLLIFFTGAGASLSESCLHTEWLTFENMARLRNQTFHRSCRAHEYGHLFAHQVSAVLSSNYDGLLESALRESRLGRKANNYATQELWGSFAGGIGSFVFMSLLFVVFDKLFTEITGGECGHNPPTNDSYSWRDRVNDTCARLYTSTELRKAAAHHSSVEAVRLTECSRWLEEIVVKTTSGSGRDETSSCGVMSHAAFVLPGIVLGSGGTTHTCIDQVIPLP